MLTSLDDTSFIVYTQAVNIYCVNLNVFNECIFHIQTVHVLGSPVITFGGVITPFSILMVPIL